MESTPDRSDPEKLRVSDADRERVTEVLRTAAADGRIDFGELDERLDATYAAKTYADLIPITVDLPDHASGATLPAIRRGSEVVTGGPQHGRGIAIMGGFDKKGVWVVPETFSILCIMGGADLDLREAKFAAPEVNISVSAFMGGANIVVNQHTHVIMDGVGIMGGFVGPAPDPDLDLDDDSPVVRISGFAIMGGVNVVRKPMPSQDAQLGWRRRH